MSEAKAVDYTAIRAFLEAQGYSIFQAKEDKMWCLYPPYEGAGYREFTTEKESVLYGLNQFLSYWLGVKWKDVWLMLPFSLYSSKTNETLKPFTLQEFEAIEQAIAFHEALG